MDAAIAVLSVVAMVALFLATVLPPIFRTFCQYFVAPFLTPRGHVRFGSYYDTEAFRSLRREGYGVAPLWASDAVRSIEKE